MDYPLFIKFKKVALSSRFSLLDMNGQTLAYVKKKMLKLKEEINVFKERDMQNLLFTIKADRIVDFSAAYTFFDQNNQHFGAIKREGMRSMWRASYLITGDNNEVLSCTEDSVFIRFMDGFLGNFLGGLFFHPSYTVKRQDGTPIMQLKKMRSITESKFKITLLGEITETEEMKILLGLMMMVILERIRG